MAMMRAEKIRPDLILTYPFIISFILLSLYGSEPDVDDLKRMGFQSSEIMSIQRHYHKILESFQPSLELSAKERRWFKNEENEQALQEVAMKILPISKKDKFIVETLRSISNFSKRWHLKRAHEGKVIRMPVNNECVWGKGFEGVRIRGDFEKTGEHNA